MKMLTLLLSPFSHRKTPKPVRIEIPKVQVKYVPVVVKNKDQYSDIGLSDVTQQSMNSGTAQDIASIPQIPQHPTEAESDRGTPPAETAIGVEQDQQGTNLESHFQKNNHNMRATSFHRNYHYSYPEQRYNHDSTSKKMKKSKKPSQVDMDYIQG